MLNIGGTSPVADRSSASWERYNIKDYDLVFLNLDSLSRRNYRALQNEGGILDDSDSNSITLPTDEDIHRLISTGGDVVATTPWYSKVCVSNTIRARYQSIVDWLPMDVSFKFESGSSINQESIVDGWEWYFDGDEFQWYSHLPNVEYHDHSGVNYKLRPLVENTYERSVAAKIEAKRSGNVVGNIYLLPLLDNWDYADFTTSVYERVILGNEVDSQEAAPDWIDDFSVPQEAELQQAISETQSQISELQDELTEKQETLSEKSEIKTLLYGNEDELENLVPEVLRELGLDVDGEVSHHRDALIKLDNERRIAVEITGLSGGISRDKCRQLNEWVTSLELDDLENEFEYSGLLIVNPLRRQPPRERSGYLTPHLEEFMEERGHKILTTPTLFELVSGYREGKFETTDVVNLLTSEEVDISLPDDRTTVDR